MNGKLMLEIATDLGIETPDYIVSVPVFRNEIKNDYKYASNSFSNAIKIAADQPEHAVVSAVSTLESLFKEILKDDSIDKLENMKFLDLFEKIQLKLHLTPSKQNEANAFLNLIKKIVKGVNDIRNKKSSAHGRKDEELENLITDPSIAVFIINCVATVGLFIKSKYDSVKQPLLSENNITPTYSPTTEIDEDDLPF